MECNSDFWEFQVRENGKQSKMCPDANLRGVLANHSSGIWDRAASPHTSRSLADRARRNRQRL
eukprot:733179-Alexandrium_andersonii.AAC.1